MTFEEITTTSGTTPDRFWEYRTAPPLPTDSDVRLPDDTHRFNPFRDPWNPCFTGALGIFAAVLAMLFTFADITLFAGFLMAIAGTAGRRRPGTTLHWVVLQIAGIVIMIVSVFVMIFLL